MKADEEQIARRSRQAALEEASDLAAGGYTDSDLDAYGRGRLDACNEIRALLQKELDSVDNRIVARPASKIQIWPIFN
jgi:hypothetical protein